MVLLEVWEDGWFNGGLAFEKLLVVWCSSVLTRGATAPLKDMEVESKHCTFP